MLQFMNFRYIADCQIVKACETFVEEHGQKIVKMDLYQNFILHMVNLFDFSITRPEVVQRTVAALDKFREDLLQYT